MKFERAGEQRVVVPAGAAHAMQEMIDFVDQRFEQRTRINFDVGQKSARRRRGRQPTARRKRRDDLLALIAAVLQDVHLILDFAAEAKDGIGIPFEETFLLEFEQAQELAVFREFLAKRFNDAMPVHRF